VNQEGTISDQRTGLRQNMKNRTRLKKGLALIHILACTHFFLIRPSKPWWLPRPFLSEALEPAEE
jgi:glutamate racemase